MQIGKSQRMIWLFLFAILSLISCNEREEQSYLSVAVAQEPPSLDVMLTSSVSGRNIVVGNVYEKLFTIENGEIENVLAESYELSNDGTRLDIKLRENVHFHDGTVLSAEDVAASLNRWLSLYQGAESIVGDARFIASGNAVSIKSRSSLALLPIMLASAPQSAVIIPASSIPADGTTLSDAPGTGPYTIKERRSGAYIELEAFSGYWGLKPEIEAIRYNFVPDSITRTLGLETGLYDFIDNVPTESLDRFREDDEITLHQGGETGSNVLVFNKREGLATDLDFRKAVSRSVDRETLMRALYGDYGYSIHSDYMDSGIWSVDPSLDSYGSKKPGVNRYEGESVRILTSNLTNLDSIAVALASELESAGMNAEITVLDWAAFLERRKDPSSWDIYVSATSRVELPLAKGYLFASSPGGFDDEVSSEVIDMIAKAESLEDAILLWNFAQLLLWEYIPVIVVGHYSTVYASDVSLVGIDFSDGFHFRAAREV